MIRRASLWLLVLVLTIAPGADWIARTAAQGASPVVVVQGAEPSSLDPISNTLAVTTNMIVNVFDSLIARGPDMSLQPGLAVKWRSVTGTVWELELRQGVQFHNGEPFNADSVVFTLQRILDPQARSPWRPHLSVVSAVEKLGEYKVRIRTSEVYAPMIARLVPIMMLPPKAYQEMGSQAFGVKPIGTGPYTVVEWVRAERIVLRANPGYWGGRSAISDVVFKTIPDDSTRVAALLTRQADIIVNVPPQDVATIERRGLKVKRIRSPRVYMVGLNTFKGPLQDVRVRQALNYAVDKEALLRTFWNGEGEAIGQPIAPDSFGYNPNVLPYPYDPDKAKRLLAEAGYPQGFEIAFDGLAGRYRTDKEIEEAIVGQIAKVGIRTRLNIIEFGTYWNRYWLGARLEGLWFLGLGDPLFDAEYVLNGMLYSKGRGWYYSTPKTDSLIERGRRTMDRVARKKTYHQLMEVLHDEAPWIFLFVGKDAYGVSARLDWEPRQDENLAMVYVKLKAGK